MVGNDKIAGARFPYLTEISLGTGPNYHYGENMNTWYSGITFTRIGNEQANGRLDIRQMLVLIWRY